MRVKKRGSKDEREGGRAGGRESMEPAEKEESIERLRDLLLVSVDWPFL